MDSIKLKMKILIFDSCHCLFVLWFYFSKWFHLFWADVFLYRWFHFTHLCPCLLLHTLFLFLVFHFILAQQVIARPTVFHTEPCARHWQMLECCDIFWQHLHAIGGASLGSIPNVGAPQNQQDLNWWISFLSFVVVNANTQLISNRTIAVFPKKKAIVSIHSLLPVLCCYIDWCILQIKSRFATII